MDRKKNLLALWISALVVLPATAQDATKNQSTDAATAQSQEKPEEAYNLGSVVVTSRKREESLQDVPVALTVFTAEQIEEANIQDIEDIAMMTPGFSYTPLFGGKVGNPVMRGLNTTIGEPNVGFFIDGVYQESRNAMSFLFGDDIERIEVARGPQNALYGRNTFAGAINIITKRPGNERVNKIRASLGDYGLKEILASQSGPVNKDSVFYRMSAMHASRDGYYTNELTGDDLDRQQTNRFTFSLYSLPTDTVETVFRVSAENTNNGDVAARFVENNANFTDNFLIPPGAFPPGHPLHNGVRFNDYQSFAGDLPGLTSGFAVTPGRNDRDNVNASFRVDWQLENMVLTSITGYNDLELNYHYDSDYEAREIRWTDDVTNQDELSQEFRLSSDNGASTHWMAGLFFYDMDKQNTLRDAFVAGAQIGPLARGLAPNLLSTTDESTRNYALFGSLGWDLTGNLSLTLSGRYSYERKEVNVVDTNLDSGQSSAFADTVSFNHFTPKIALDYRFSEDSMAYFSVAKAVKSGGFNTVTASGLITQDERHYDEETSLNYELGFKNSWLDNKVFSNLALYYIDWKDQIVRALGENGAVLNANAGESSSKGFEFELTAKPSENWDFNAGISYTDAQYDRYVFVALAALGIDPVLDGQPIQYVPDWMANASVQYTKPAAFGDYDWKTRLDFMYQAERSAISIQNPPILPERTLINLSTGIENDRYAFRLWVKNLLDDDAPPGAVAIPNPAQAADFLLLRPGYQRFQALVQAPEPRTVGVTATLKF